MVDVLETRSERVDLRMTPKAKRTLQRAAARANKSLTDFLIDSGMAAAFDALADRRVFHIADSEWAAFEAALARSPADNPALRDLLMREPVWGS